MNEIQELSADINVITAEINSYKQVAGQAIFEIGKRLKHVKENDLQHGEYTAWLSSINMSQSVAYKYISIYKEHEKNPSYHLLTNDFTNNLDKMYHISTLSAEQQKETFPTSKGEEKKPGDMTVKELRELKQQLKEAESQAEQARKNERIALKRAEKAESKPPEVIERVIEDETKINKLNQELKQIRQEKIRIESIMNQEKQDAESYRVLQKELSELKGKRDELEREIESARSIAKFIVNIEKALQEDLAPMKYSKALNIHRNDPVIIENVQEILIQVENWCDEVRGLLPSENYINAEVIDYE